MPVLGVRVSGDTELAVLVTDRYQGSGLGTHLLGRLIEIAPQEKVERVIAHILAENHAMLHLAKHFHFALIRDEDPSALLAILDLTASSRK